MCSDIRDLLVVKVKSGDCIIGRRPRRFLGNLAHRTILRRIDHAVLAGIAHPIAKHDRSGGLLRRWLECVDKAVTIIIDIRQIPGGFKTRIALLYDVSNGQERSSRARGVQTGRLTTLLNWAARTASRRTPAVAACRM
jgi:hypothetical protein